MIIHYGAASRTVLPARQANSNFHDLNQWWRSRSGGRGRSREGMDGAGLVWGTGMDRAIKCRVCGKGRAGEGEDCPYCGATVRSVLGRGAPLPASAMAEMIEERRVRKNRLDACIRRRLRSHAIVGTLIFALCGIVSAAGAFALFMITELAKVYFVDNTVGCQPSTGLDLNGILLRMSFAFLLAAFLGPVAGYLVSYLRRGMRFGVVVGGCAFGLCVLLVNPAGVPGGPSHLLLLVVLTAIGSLPGMVAGTLLGWHVASEPL